MFKKRNYNAGKTIEVDLSRMCPMNCEFDNGAIGNLLPEHMVKPDWTGSVHVSEKPRPEVR